jgi:hypothetical protein
MLGHSRRAQTVHHRAKSPARRIAEPHPILHAAAAVPVAQRAAPVHRSSGKRRHGGPSGDDRGNGDAETGSSGKDGGRADDAAPVEARTTTVSGTRGSGHEGSVEESGGDSGSLSDGHGSESSSGDSSGSGDTSGSSGSSHGDDVSMSGSGNGDSGGGDSGHGGSSNDGGVVTTTANQVVTVSVTTEGEPPATGESAPGGGG